MSFEDYYTYHVLDNFLIAVVMPENISRYIFAFLEFHNILLLWSLEISSESVDK